MPQYLFLGGGLFYDPAYSQMAGQMDHEMEGIWKEAVVS
jgi:hypothetical protein